MNAVSFKWTKLQRGFYSRRLDIVWLRHDGLQVRWLS